ncbi:hypothetical protein BABINDRAFT_162322 [Babjeviella inositovora NRRL Y-12698]|uniref:DUF7082 domain-containing protein n=1 Tax=Babjeviella inositovora NRRL Y-12698 TaxID=984486 RepID=A0A1E3QNN4_9ASCO|nr:uncharacterized protein BABINDRAFT_162322 [Babjeviella inositovora NRRL Y-12698]ODQ79295.1 hypothetical protein BABINDRAFT_162322 [Babjeviella inositovora NRRL Y-12698]
MSFNYESPPYPQGSDVSSSMEYMEPPVGYFSAPAQYSVPADQNDQMGYVYAPPGYQMPVADVPASNTLQVYFPNSDFTSFHSDTPPTSTGLSFATPLNTPGYHHAFDPNDASAYPQTLLASPFNQSQTFQPPFQMFVPQQNIVHYPSAGPEFVQYDTPAMEYQPESFQFQATPLQADSKTFDKSIAKRCKVVRGISSGGSATRPPKAVPGNNSTYLPVSLQLNDASVEELCYPNWNQSEIADARRIIRIERFQYGFHIGANFSIVGSAEENPETKPAPPGADVLEVSCLECYVSPREELEDAGDLQAMLAQSDIKRKRYYITSVEVIKIVELLIGSRDQDAADKRKERGRIRSNLVPFWSRRPISSRSHHSSTPMSYTSSPESYTPAQLNQADFRVEMAKRIMGYEHRKPRGFDKEVRILRWEKLGPALMRALQCYYAEIPMEDFL